MSCRWLKNVHIILSIFVLLISNHVNGYYHSKVSNSDWSEEDLALLRSTERRYGQIGNAPKQHKVSPDSCYTLGNRQHKRDPNVKLGLNGFAVWNLNDGVDEPARAIRFHLKQNCQDMRGYVIMLLDQNNLPGIHYADFKNTGVPIPGRAYQDLDYEREIKPGGMLYGLPEYAKSGSILEWDEPTLSWIVYENSIRHAPGTPGYDSLSSEKLISDELRRVIKEVEDPNLSPEQVLQRDFNMESRKAPRAVLANLRSQKSERERKFAIGFRRPTPYPGAPKEVPPVDRQLPRTLFDFEDVQGSDVLEADPLDINPSLNYGQEELEDLFKGFSDALEEKKEVAPKRPPKFSHMRPEDWEILERQPLSNLVGPKLTYVLPGDLDILDKKPKTRAARPERNMLQAEDWDNLFSGEQQGSMMEPARSTGMEPENSEIPRSTGPRRNRRNPRANVLLDVASEVGFPPDMSDVVEYPTALENQPLVAESQRLIKASGPDEGSKRSALDEFFAFEDAPKQLPEKTVKYEPKFPDTMLRGPQAALYKDDFYDGPAPGAWAATFRALNPDTGGSDIEPS